MPTAVAPSFVNCCDRQMRSSIISQACSPFYHGHGTTPPEVFDNMVQSLFQLGSFCVPGQCSIGFNHTSARSARIHFKLFVEPGVMQEYLPTLEPQLPGSVEMISGITKELEVYNARFQEDSFASQVIALQHQEPNFSGLKYAHEHGPIVLFPHGCGVSAHAAIAVALEMLESIIGREYGFVAFHMVPTGFDAEPMLLAAKLDADIFASRLLSHMSLDVRNAFCEAHRYVQPDRQYVSERGHPRQRPRQGLHRRPLLDLPPRQPPPRSLPRDIPPQNGVPKYQPPPWSLPRDIPPPNGDPKYQPPHQSLPWGRPSHRDVPTYQPPHRSLPLGRPSHRDVPKYQPPYRR